MTGLEAYLRPAPVPGEALRFDLSAFRSTVTRQLLQVRVRMTAIAFGVGDAPIAANVTGGGATLEVDAGALMEANAAVRATLDAGPEGAVRQLRSLSASRRSLDRIAGRFAGMLGRGLVPRQESFVAYVLASARDQALGALKFCLPEGLRPRVQELMGETDLADALLAPDGPSLWSAVRAQELVLARLRADGPEVQYRSRLERYRREYGYLGAEDVDFRASETLDAIDARVARLDPVDERRRLTSALAADRARKALARQVFADRLQSERTGDAARLVSHVLLARALAEHEDRNRRAKMRLLRDLRDLADLDGLDGLDGLDLETGGLEVYGRRQPRAARVG